MESTVYGLLWLGSNQRQFGSSVVLGLQKLSGSAALGYNPVILQLGASPLDDFLQAPSEDSSLHPRVRRALDANPQLASVVTEDPRLLQQLVRQLPVWLD